MTAKTIHNEQGRVTGDYNVTQKNCQQVIGTRGFADRLNIIVVPEGMQ